MVPPSSGGVGVLQILGILERTPFASAPPQSVHAVHYFSEAGRLAYADRARYLGDPDLVTVPVARLLSGEYLERRAGGPPPRPLRPARPRGRGGGGPPLPPRRTTRAARARAPPPPTRARP